MKGGRESPEGVARQNGDATKKYTESPSGARYGTVTFAANAGYGDPAAFIAASAYLKWLSERSGDGGHPAALYHIPMESTYAPRGFSANNTP